MKHAGIVLAAGASTRMGSPKALLPTPSGQPLAAYQADLLAQAGCRETVIVLGSDHEALEAPLNHHLTVENPDWKEGRLGSVQTGLATLPGFDGYLILPVDTVRVHFSTLIELLAVADEGRAQAVRPRCEGKVGHVAWIASALREDIRGILDPDTRLDDIIDPVATYMETEDTGVLNNINTPEEWETVLADWPRL